MKKLLNGVFFTAVAINPQDDASGVSRTATAHLQPVISVLRQFDGEVDDESKENTTWVSTASGVHDNACLSKGIVVRLGRLELPRPHGHWNLNPARLPIPPQALVLSTLPFFSPETQIPYWRVLFPWERGILYICEFRQ